MEPSGAASLDWIAELRADQRLRWQTGKRFPVEAYLHEFPALAAHSDALLDLIHNEILLREEAGEAPRLEEYLDRFPRLATQLKSRHAPSGKQPGAGMQETQVLTHGLAPLSPETTPPAPPAVRQNVPGYEIIEVIGHGGMGVVYKAVQLSLKRPVAVKMIIGGVHVSPEHQARFRREAEAVARLHHPNIVQIFEVGDADGHAYLSLELLDGGNLAQRLTGQPITPQEAARTIATLARAIHHAHERGIIHRDLKPANVLFTADGTPKIADFGLAKQLDGPQGHTTTGTILGTPAYMAPEQARGGKKDIGRGVDVYALGAILYEMLTGQPPFRGETPLETLMKAAAVDPERPSRIQPRCPRDLETIALRCLEKGPGNRYPTALALAEELERFLDGKPIAARERKPRRVWWLGGAGVVLLAVVLGLVAWFWPSQPPSVFPKDEPSQAAEGILRRHCLECHGGKKTTRRLNVLDLDALLTDERKLIVPGNPEASLLIQRIEDPDAPMPPDTHPPVSPADRQALRDWIGGMR